MWESGPRFRCWVRRSFAGPPPPMGHMAGGTAYVTKAPAMVVRDGTLALADAMNYIAIAVDAERACHGAGTDGRVTVTAHSASPSPPVAAPAAALSAASPDAPAP